LSGCRDLLNLGWWHREGLANEVDAQAKDIERCKGPDEGFLWGHFDVCSAKVGQNKLSSSDERFKRLGEKDNVINVGEATYP
jgi:hypothetical protein